MSTSASNAAIDKKLLSALAELGGRRVAEDAVRREGTELILPASMNEKSAIKFLQKRLKTLEEITTFSRIYKYRPDDGAHAVQAALKKVFGTLGLPKATQTFFGERPPELRTINIGPGETTQVPWGLIDVPLFEGELELHGTGHEELGVIFAVTVNAPRKYNASIEGFFEVIQQELENNSIYRGKYIDGRYEFHEIDEKKINELVLKQETWAQLGANVFSPLEHTEKVRSLGMSLKRTALFKGPYGTGKSLTASKVAKIATENEWTFLYCKPGRDNLLEVMQTARLYQPAVVFFEDVDSVSSDSSSRQSIVELLDIFDGITAKNTEILAIMTTNHPEKIHKGMIRPGRLDAVIHFGDLDHEGVEQLIKKQTDDELLVDIDYAAINKAVDQFTPAFVKEVIDRAKHYALYRNNGTITSMSTEDFVEAAEGLLTHKELMDGAHEDPHIEPLDAAVERIVTRVQDDTSVTRDGGYFGELSTSKK